MSGIFDLFSGTGNSAKNQSSWGVVDSAKKPSATSMNFGNGATSAKNIGPPRPKPKGLSIRTTSDLNVSSFAVNGERSPLKKSPIKGQHLKAEIGPFGSITRQLSPRSREKNSKLQALKSKQLKALSAKARSPDKISPSKRMLEETNVFRKPFTSKMERKPVKVYPEAEKLAHYYNEDDEYSVIDILDREFVRLVRLSKPPIKPYDDEGFESDPGLISQPSVDIFDEPSEEITLKSPSLPSFSDDDEDDFF